MHQAGSNDKVFVNVDRHSFRLVNISGDNFNQSSFFVVQLYSVISLVSHHQVELPIKADAPWFAQLSWCTSWSSKFKQEVAVCIEYVDEMIIGVGDIVSVILVDSDVSGSPQRGLWMRSKFPDNL